MRTKFTFRLTCNGEERKLVLTQAQGESTDHVALKLVSYLLFFAREPLIEVDVGQHFKPDLACLDEDGQVTLWVDCGTTSLQKLNRVATKNHRAEVYIVKPFLRRLESYRQQAGRRVKHDERVRYLTFEDGFIDALVGALERSNDLTARVAADRSRIDLELNGVALSSEVWWL